MDTKVKSAKRRTKQTEAAQAEPLDPERQKQIESLSLGLALFGFAAPVPLIEQWTIEARSNIVTCIERWRNEHNRARSGEVILLADRTPVPSLLASIEAVDALDAKKAVIVAQEDRAAGRTLEHNPYPPESAIGKIWVEAFGATEAPVGLAEAAATIEATVPVPANQAELDQRKAEKTKPNAEKAAVIEATKEVDRKADLERQQQLAIEAAQDELEEAATHQGELEEQLVDMKAEMKELKAAFDNAGSRARKAAKTLRRARDGIFERTLPFPKEQKSKSIEVPDVTVDSNGVATETPPAEPVKPAVDEGAFVLLDHLVKDDLQEFIPGTPEEKGISQKQADNLKEVVGGETIGDLEKWIKSKGDWWLKELKDSGKGFGKETVTKVQDAHEIIRRKFPIPSPDELAPEAAKATEQPVAAERPITFDEAVEGLEDLRCHCEIVIDDCENQDGVKFAKDVLKKSREVLATIERTKEVTDAQSESIKNWTKGVDEWYSRLDDEIEDDEDDDEESLDVPDEDGHDDEF